MAPCGLLIVDKPAGCTSHDVVAWARRAFGTREVGHAGTLDPAATGVLVLLVGEATKLSSWITAEDKSYDATLRFGVETDSLDLDGAVTRTVREGEAVDAAALAGALASMRGTMSQVPPAVSAVKVDGVAAHERVRRGEDVVLAARDVSLLEVALRDVRGADADISLTCSKGFYVRSFARDLAARLGTVAHLRALRRTRSGCFTLAEAVAGDVLRAARTDLDARAAARARLIPLARLEGRVASLRLDAARAQDMLRGRAVRAPEALPDAVLLCLFDRDDRALPPQPLGLGRVTEGVLRAERNLAGQTLHEARLGWLDGEAP
jgi:tRNA pseudouridine55 synthase